MKNKMKLKNRIGLPQDEKCHSEYVNIVAKNYLKYFVNTQRNWKIFCIADSIHFYFFEYA